MIRSLAFCGLIPLFLYGGEPIELVLPTDNRALLEGKPSEFYMYVSRTFEEEVSTPWTGGQYGFVRTLKRTEKEGVIATKFHEGLDIKPTRRDRNGNPLDKVKAIADGEVVHINNSAGGSSYGKYVVIRHDWECGPFYSLYAHLSLIDTEIGEKLIAGQPFAEMGYTGAGINRTRAHLHLELCMLSTENFSDWIGAKTPHGIYDGRNLIGIDVASLLIASDARDDVTIPEFMKAASPYYKVAIPRDAKELEITTRYPWLKKGDHSAASPSLEIAFTDSGIPLAVTPSFREVREPTVTFVRTTRSRHEYYTRGRLTGEGRQATLTRSGRKFIAIFTNEYTKTQTDSEDSDDS